MKILLVLIGVVFLSANLIAVHGGGGETIVFSPSAWTVDRLPLGEPPGAPPFVFLQKAIVVPHRSSLPAESGVVSIAPQGIWKTSGGQTASERIRYRLHPFEQ